MVTPRGELDLSAIASLDTAVRTALTATRAPAKLIVDLSEVSVLHPVVLGVLLDARRRCNVDAGRLALVVTAPEVAATLADTGVAPLFDVTADLPAALSHLTCA